MAEDAKVEEGKVAAEVGTVPAPEPDEVITPESDGVDWSSMFSSEENEGEPAGVKEEAKPETEGAGKEPAAEKEGKAPVEPATPESEPAPTQEGETAETPEVEAETPTPAPEQEVVPEPEFKEVDILSQLESFYKLSETDKESWDTDSGEMLPALAARMHYNIFNSIMQAVMAQIPNAVQQSSLQQTAVEKFNTDFFKKWPKLTAHAETVNRFLQSYAQAMPQAKEEQLINDVGLQTMIALKLDFGDTAPVKKNKPFSPAAPAAGGAGIPQKESKSVWDELVEDTD